MPDKKEKTIFTSCRNQTFVGITNLSDSAKRIINSNEFKSRLPEGMNFWIENTDENNYFLGVITDGTVLNWQESSALWNYLVDTYKSDLLMSDKIKNKQHLLDFIADCIEKELEINELSTTIYVRNVQSFKYTDLEKNVEHIMISHENNDETTNEDNYENNEN